MSGRGGDRHFAKPYIDPDIVFKILSDNDLILCNIMPLTQKESFIAVGS